MDKAENFGFTEADQGGEGRVLSYIAAISEALREEMRRDPDVLLLGEDIAGDFGGAFKVTKGFEKEFGARRVMNTPVSYTHLDVYKRQRRACRHGKTIAACRCGCRHRRQ